MNIKKNWGSFRAYSSLIFLASFLFAAVSQAVNYEEIAAAQSGKVLAATTMVFSNIQISNITTTSATVTWTTNVPATSQVVITDFWTAGQTSTTFYQPWRRQPEPKDSSLVTNHSVTLTNLIPNNFYTMEVSSVDASGNGASSGQFTSAGVVVAGTYPTFTTQNISTTTPIDYRIDPNAGKNVYAGSDLYVGYRLIMLSGAEASWKPLASVSGLPSSITAHVICHPNNNPANEAADNASGSCNRSYNYGNIRLRTSASTPPGTYTAAITSTMNGVSKIWNYTFNVLPAPSPIVKQTVSSIPPIPGLAKWESTMLTLGNKWCNSTSTMLFGWEQQEWFYDGGRVYLQIGDYTQNRPTWLPCAENILTQYANYANVNNGAMPGYRKFPFGLLMHYLRYGDDPSKQAVINLYNGVNMYSINGAGTSGSLTNPGRIRELAYAIDCLVAGEAVGLPRSQFLPIAVNGALSMFDALYNSDPMQFNQPFFGGVMAEALINYYELTHTVGSCRVANN